MYAHQGVKVIPFGVCSIPRKETCTLHKILLSDFRTTTALTSSMNEHLFINSGLLCAYNNCSLPVGEKCSCLQTTLASVTSHMLSQIVPHSFLKQISTRPSVLLSPPTSLNSPTSHPIITYNNEYLLLAN